MAGYFPLFLALLGLYVRGSMSQAISAAQIGYPPVTVAAQVGMAPDTQAAVMEAPPAPPLIQPSIPIIISPQPLPIPTYVQRPAYYILPPAPAPVAQPTNIAAAGPGLAFSGNVGLPGIAAQAGGNIPINFIPNLIHPEPERIFAIRRSVSHAQSGIEQIGTGNNILQGNVQQIQLGKRRGLLCDDCLNFMPHDSSLFGFKSNSVKSSQGPFGFGPFSMAQS